MTFPTCERCESPSDVQLTRVSAKGAWKDGDNLDLCRECRRRVRRDGGETVLIRAWTPEGGVAERG